MGWAVLAPLWSNPDPAAPIAFNHRKHAEAGITCKDCHEESRKVAGTTLPDLDFCLMCHASAITESGEEEKIRRLAAKGEAVVWQRFTRVPGDVYFSHRRHVTLGQIECGACHGDVGISTAVTSERVRRPTMAACMDCHAQYDVRNDCNDCHR